MTSCFDAKRIWATMKDLRQQQHPNKEAAKQSSETASITSDPSTAIVSLYNSWSRTNDDSRNFARGDDDDGLDAAAGEVDVEYGLGITLADTPIIVAMEPVDLLECLKKRCREEDLPPVPELRPRKRPNCVFLNYMGATRVHVQQPETPADTISTALDFKFGGSDAFLYPVYSEKVKHDEIDQDEAEGLVRRLMEGKDIAFGPGFEIDDIQDT